MLKKQVFTVEYYWHLGLQHYNERLMNDCSRADLKMKMKWKVKALYHHSKVLELFSKLQAIAD